MASVQRTWSTGAIQKLRDENELVAETPLLTFPLPAEWGISLYLKDESQHPTGSLKHRLAHSLLLYALVNGEVDENTTLVEASSGSTAVSEAYFARLLGLKFVAVIPRVTSPLKIATIEEYGGRCELVDPQEVCAEAERLGRQPGWLYLDQFGKASTATDWRGSGNIAQSIFGQLAEAGVDHPSWIVVGAGTGGTSATIGRYCRSQGIPSQVAVVDPEGSVFHRAWTEGRRDITDRGSRIEGIGRPRVEESFIPSVIDEVIRVPDAASIAGMQLLTDFLGFPVGGSTGTNLFGSLLIAARMRAAGETGSIVTIICDSGDRYATTYYSEGWLRQQMLDPAHHLGSLRVFLRTGSWPSSGEDALVSR